MVVLVWCYLLNEEFFSEEMEGGNCWMVMRLVNRIKIMYLLLIVVFCCIMFFLFYVVE